MGRFYLKEEMSVHVLVVNWKYDVSWCNNLRYPHTIVSNSPLRVGQFPNIGFEHSSYLKWIIDNYYCLPDVCVFCHGHNDFHKTAMTLLMDDNYSNLEYINNFSFNLDYFNYNPLELGNAYKSIYMNPDYIGSFDGDYKYIIESALGFEIDYSNVACKKYAQFYVKKELIHQYPIDFWKNLYNQLMIIGRGNDESVNLKLAIVFEHSWHIIFTRSIIDVNYIFEP